MSDIVESLRGMVGEYIGDADIDQYLNKAADEIERLRAQVAALLEALSELAEQHNQPEQLSQQEGRTTQIDDPPAFPQLEITSCERDGHGDVIEPFTSVRGGMTLRDWFAGEMLSAVVANKQCAPLSSVYNPSLVARLCYETADAMLQQRAKRGREMTQRYCDCERSANGIGAALEDKYAATARAALKEEKST